MLDKSRRGLLRWAAIALCPAMTTTRNAGGTPAPQSGSGATTAAQASLKFEQPWQNLGRVQSIGNVVRDFAFVNVGDKAIEILEVRPSCGCLRPKLEKRVYAPGERGVLALGIHATSQRAGKHRFQLAITAREERIRTYEVGVDVDLYSDVAVEPSNLLIYVGGQTSLERPIVIRDARKSTWRIESARSTDRRIAAAIVDAEADAAGNRRVQVAIRGDFPVGRHDAYVEIRTNDPEYGVFEIPVTVAREPRVTALPSQLTLPRESLAVEGVSRTLLLRDGRGAPVRVNAVTTSHPGVRAELKTGANSRPICTVRFDRSKLEAPLLAQVRFDVAEPQPCEIVVPIRID